MNAFLPDIDESEKFIRLNQFKRAKDYFYTKSQTSTSLEEQLHSKILLAKHQLYLGEYEAAKSILTYVEKKLAAPNDLEMTELYFFSSQVKLYFGSLYLEKGKYWKAIEYLRNAIADKILDPLPEEEFLLGDCYFEISKAYCELLDFDQALLNLHCAILRYLAADPRQSDYRFGRALNFMGKIYWFKDELEISKQLFTRARRVLNDQLKKNHYFRYFTERNNALWLWKKGKKDRNIASIQQAEKKLQRCLKMLKYSFPEDQHPEYGILYDSIGIIYASQRNKHAHAFDAYNKAKIILEKYIGKNNPEIGRVYNNIGFLKKLHFESENDPSSLNFALENFQLAMFSVVDGFKEIYPHYKNPETLHISATKSESNIDSFKVLINSLEKKADLYTKLLKNEHEEKLQKKKKKEEEEAILEKFAQLEHPEDLEDFQSLFNENESEERDHLSFNWAHHADRTIDTAFSLFKKISVFLYNTGTRFFYHKKFQLICEHAFDNYYHLIQEERKGSPYIKTSSEIKYINNAFNIFEFLKVLFQLEDFYEIKTKKNDVDYKQKKKKITKYNQSFLNFCQRPVNENLIEELEINAKIEAYSDFVHWNSNMTDTDAMEDNMLKTSTIKDLQKELNDDKGVILSFFSGKDHYYCFVIEKNSFNLIKLDASKETINREIIEFKSLLDLDDESSIKRGFSRYKNLAFSIYTNVFLPCIKLLDDVDRIYIITDGELSNLPFEALIKDQGGKDYSGLSYLLLEEYSFSYHFSASILCQSYLKPDYQVADLSDTDYQFVGFAPVDFQSDNYENHDEAINHLERLKKLFIERGFLEQEIKTYIKEHSTISSFNKLVNKSKIVHVISHMDHSKNGGEILFYNHQSLNVIDILSYNSLKASLVFLGGCSSGTLTQELEIKALNRAFLVVDAQNIIFTTKVIWDHPTTYLLIEKFYEYILAGDTYVVALKKAKQVCLGLKDFGVYPNFWNSLNFIGNQRHSLITSSSMEEVRTIPDNRKDE